MNQPQFFVLQSVNLFTPRVNQLKIQTTTQLTIIISLKNLILIDKYIFFKRFNQGKVSSESLS